jgi:hypothetical protein
MPPELAFSILFLVCADLSRLCRQWDQIEDILILQNMAAAERMDCQVYIINNKSISDVEQLSPMNS